jgi:hypothetical protein
MSTTRSCGRNLRHPAKQRRHEGGEEQQYRDAKGHGGAQGLHPAALKNAAPEHERRTCKWNGGGQEDGFSIGALLPNAGGKADHESQGEEFLEEELEVVASW